MSVLLRAGFVPLVDAAVLVAAKELEFAASNGIDLELVRQPSWALLRDHLNLGYLDCAQTPAPLPIAAALGLGQVRSRLAVPFVLSRGGNAITVTRSLADELRQVTGGDQPGNATQWGEALGRLIHSRPTPVTLAMVYPFSGHNYELRHWLSEAGIDPDDDVRIVPIPPPLIVDSMKAGQIDGFCVGEPWNSLAVANGVGEIIVTKAEIFPGAIEKVLAVRQEMLQEADPLDDLLRALDEAALWCDEPANHAALAGILGRPEYVSVDPQMILSALRGELLPGEGCIPDFLYFHRHDSCRPCPADAIRLYEQIFRWGQAEEDATDRQTAAEVFAEAYYAELFGTATES